MTQQLVTLSTTDRHVKTDGMTQQLVTPSTTDRHVRTDRMTQQLVTLSTTDMWGQTEWHNNWWHCLQQTDTWGQTEWHNNWWHCLQQTQTREDRRNDTTIGDTVYNRHRHVRTDGMTQQLVTLSTTDTDTWGQTEWHNNWWHCLQQTQTREDRWNDTTIGDTVYNSHRHVRTDGMTQQLVTLSTTDTDTWGQTEWHNNWWHCLQQTDTWGQMELHNNWWHCLQQPQTREDRQNDTTIGDTVYNSHRHVTTDGITQQLVTLSTTDRHMRTDRMTQQLVTLSTTDTDTWGQTEWHNNWWHCLQQTQIREDRRNDTTIGDTVYNRHRHVRTDGMTQQLVTLSTTATDTWGQMEWHNNWWHCLQQTDTWGQTEWHNNWWHCLQQTQIREDRRNDTTIGDTVYNRHRYVRTDGMTQQLVTLSTTDRRMRTDGMTQQLVTLSTTATDTWGQTEWHNNWWHCLQQPQTGEDRWNDTTIGDTVSWHRNQNMWITTVLHMQTLPWFLFKMFGDRI